MGIADRLDQRLDNLGAALTSRFGGSEPTVATSGPRDWGALLGAGRGATDFSGLGAGRQGTDWGALLGGGARSGFDFGGLLTNGPNILASENNYGTRRPEAADFFNQLANIRGARAAANGAKEAGGAIVEAGQGGGPSTGLEPDVAKWADKTKQVFGDIQGLDPDTMLAIMTNESHGKPTAYNANGNAYGLFQQVGLGSYDPNVQFSAAHQLAQEKMASINKAYAANGLNPDARTRALDFAAAWAGHFDYDSGKLSTTSVDYGVGGQTAAQFAQVFLGNYDKIKAGRTPQANGSGPNGGVVAAGAKYLGAPYALGGLRTHPDNPMAGIDCSEFTATAYKQATGIDLPWNAQAQYNATERVDPAHLQVGDLVFFQGTYDTGRGEFVTHVGIYAGNGKMLNASSEGVSYQDLNSDYWRGHLAGYGRVPRAAGGGGQGLTP